MPKYRFRNLSLNINGSIFKTRKYTPDVLINENWDYLRSLGFDAQIIPLPGHTYGSIGILSDGVLYCGDAFTAMWGKPDITPHAVNIEMMKETVKTILKIDPKWLACGHGAPLKMDEAKPVIREYLGL